MWSDRGGEGPRLVKPPAIAALLPAIDRIHSEAVVLADNAHEAIQRHSFGPYRQFCEKRAEHAALVSVLRAHITARPQDPSWTQTVNQAESSLVRLSIQACVKFAFALSANPQMPLGARETFIHELAMLQRRARCSPPGRKTRPSQACSTRSIWR
jgi:hypothetical protein